MLSMVLTMDGAVLKKPKQIKRPKQLTLLDNDNIKAKILNKNEQEGSGHSSAFAILVYFFMIYGDRFAPKKGSPSIPRNNAQPKQSALHPGSQKGTIPTTKKGHSALKKSPLLVIPVPTHGRAGESHRHRIRQKSVSIKTLPRPTPKDSTMAQIRQQQEQERGGGGNVFVNMDSFNDNFETNDNNDNTFGRD